MLYCRNCRRAIEKSRANATHIHGICIHYTEKLTEGRAIPTNLRAHTAAGVVLLYYACTVFFCAELFFLCFFAFRDHAAETPRRPPPFPPPLWHFASPSSSCEGHPPTLRGVRGGQSRAREQDSGACGA